uniref:Uncharacterized protein n=1 Tax=Nothoprocta perdicaria TaxID=30464 RepID=A0A8C7EFM4_NOTPE
MDSEPNGTYLLSFQEISGAVCLLYIAGTHSQGLFRKFTGKLVFFSCNINEAKHCNAKYFKATLYDQF